MWSRTFPKTPANGPEAFLQDPLDDLSGTEYRTMTYHWFGYFQHSTCPFVFDRLDGWLRGRGRGADNQRWPNRFFADQGLFSLTAAQASARQSSRR